MNVCILVDPAGGEELNKKKRKLSDWTAMMVVGLAPDNNYYLLDVIRDRMNPTDRINMLFVLHRKWNALCGKPPKVGYEKYGMMTDTHYITQKKKDDAYNFQLIELGGSMGKEERIRRLIPDMQNGRWYFPAGLIYVDVEGRKFDLVQEMYNSEMATFPRARHDDMLDALSRLYDMDMAFPRPRSGMVAKAIRKGYNSNTNNWEDW
jgi:predicted phage terminase large subunit-like protein